MKRRGFITKLFVGAAAAPSIATAVVNNTAWDEVAEAGRVMQEQAILFPRVPSNAFDPDVTRKLLKKFSEEFENARTLSKWHSNDTITIRRPTQYQSR